MDKYIICVDLPEDYSRELEVTKDSFLEFISFYEEVLNYKIEKFIIKNSVFYVSHTKYFGRIDKNDED